MLYFMSQIYCTTLVNLYMTGNWNMIESQGLVSLNPPIHHHVRLDMQKFAPILLLKSYMLCIIKEIDMYIWSILQILINVAVFF